MKEYFNPEICKKCGGECCKRQPAPYTPMDIMRIFGSVEIAIQSGKVAIDWWGEIEKLYFFRPKVQGVYQLYHPSWGGVCIHWTETGCELPREKMPYFCKIGKPSETRNCHPPYRRHNERYYAGLLWKRTKIDFNQWR